MSDLFSTLQHSYLIAAFVLGLGGSLHCIGMCGGLVTSTCQKKNDIASYQVGRLLGYLFLGLLGGYIGYFLDLKNISPFFTLFSGLLLGLFFILWGISDFRGKGFHLPIPKTISKIYGKQYARTVKLNPLSKSFFVGLFSLLLPCGLLYSVVLTSIAIKDPLLSSLSMFSFWLGTLPAMVLAPSVVNKLLLPLKNILPKTYSVALILIGVVTIGLRVNNFSSGQHATSHMQGHPEAKTQMCH